MGRIRVDGSGVRYFGDAVAGMERLLVELLAAPVAPRAEHRYIPGIPGVYLFSDEKPVYVGQTRNLNIRLRNHTGATATENQASSTPPLRSIRSRSIPLRPTDGGESN